MRRSLEKTEHAVELASSSWTEARPGGRNGVLWLSSPNIEATRTCLKKQSFPLTTMNTFYIFRLCLQLAAPDALQAQWTAVTFVFSNESEAHFAILSTPFRTVAHNPYPLRLPRNPLSMRNYIRDRPVFSGAPVHCNSTMLARSVSTLTSSADAIGLRCSQPRWATTQALGCTQDLTYSA